MSDQGGEVTHRQVESCSEYKVLGREADRVHLVTKPGFRMVSKMQVVSCGLLDRGFLVDVY